MYTRSKYGQQRTEKANTENNGNFENVLNANENDVQNKNENQNININSAQNGFNYQNVNGTSNQPQNNMNSFFPNGQYSYMPPKPETPKKKKKSGKFSFATVIVSAVVAAVIGASSAAVCLYTAGYNSSNNNSSSSASLQTASASNSKITIESTASNAVEAVATKAGPSVVGIRTTASVASFFGNSSEQSDEGSGIIYTADGYIITNYHVISPALESRSSKIEVYLSSDQKTAISASVVGYNITSDLAVIKINKTGLTPIELADSSKLKVGQYAIAIGNPGGLEFMNSVSYGIISGLNRSVSTGTGTSMALIQTDAAINPGNSGGALLNTEGKLIGVNSAKLVDTSFEGMGFAIPVNSVKEICNKIISKQNDPTPYIGIEISQTYTAEALKNLGYPEGAVVNGVTSGGPASESGIRRGDIITEFNGKTISSYKALEDAIKDSKVGDTVTVKLYRSGRFYSTNITVASNTSNTK